MMIKSFTLDNSSQTITRQDLEECATDIAQKYQTGCLPELQAIGWTVAWRYLIKDLKASCPGFSDIEYGLALNQSFVGHDRLADA